MKHILPWLPGGHRPDLCCHRSSSLALSLVQILNGAAFRALLWACTLEENIYISVYGCMYCAIVNHVYADAQGSQKRATERHCSWIAGSREIAGMDSGNQIQASGRAVSALMNRVIASTQSAPALKLNMTLNSNTTMLGTESRTLRVVGKHSELPPQPICTFRTST